MKKQAEDRLATASGEAAQAQAVAAAARTAGREAMEKVSSAEREAKLRREEAMGLRAELQRARAACAEKVRGLLEWLYSSFENLFL